MIPFYYCAPHVLWWKKWNDNIQLAKKFPDMAEGYSKAAMICQMMYRTLAAQAVVAYSKGEKNG